MIPTNPGHPVDWKNPLKLMNTITPAWLKSPYASKYNGTIA